MPEIVITKESFQIIDSIYSQMVAEIIVISFVKFPILYLAHKDLDELVGGSLENEFQRKYGLERNKSNGSNKLF